MPSAPGLQGRSEPGPFLCHRFLTSLGLWGAAIGADYFQLEGTWNFYGARKSCPQWPWWLRQDLSGVLFLEHKFSRHGRWVGVAAATTGTEERECVILLRKHGEVVVTAI